MKEPTNKQISLARAISYRIDKPLPTQYTSKAYYDYIHDNIDDYKMTTADIELASETFDGFQYQKVRTNMKCKECPFFKILYETLGKGKYLFDFGKAKCNKHNLFVDFTSHRKLNKLECIESEE